MLLNLNSSPKYMRRVLVDFDQERLDGTAQPEPLIEMPAIASSVIQISLLLWHRQCNNFFPCDSHIANFTKPRMAWPGV